MTTDDTALVPQSEKERLDALAAQMRLRQRDGQGEPSRVSLEQFRQHPRVRAAMESATDEEAQAQMDEIDRQATLDVHRKRCKDRWEEYVATRPFDFAGAAIADLHPDKQNPQGRVAGWWRSGHRTLLLAGPHDAGKSHCAYAITNTVAALDREAPLGTMPITVRAYQVVEIANDLISYDTASKARTDLLRDLMTCDLLYLDDLGREKMNDKWREQLFRILDARATDKRKRQIISANFTQEQRDEGLWKIMARNVESGGRAYGSPIVSRIQQDCLGAWINGAPHRNLVATWRDPFATPLESA